MKRNRNTATSLSLAKADGVGDGKGNQMINAYYKGEKIVEVCNLGYLINVPMKNRVVIVKLENGKHESARLDAVELREE
jgi:hypothetical protein